MPKTCHRCGAVLEENAPFCAQCGAPQIRVMAPEPAPAEIADSVVLGNQPAIPTRKINWSRAFIAVLVPALIAALLMLVPIANLGFFLWIALAGAASVLMYARRAPNAVIDAGIGARLGALVGVLAFALQSVLMGFEIAASAAAGKSEYRDQVVQALHQQAARNPDPHAVALMNKWIENPQALALLLIGSLILLFLLFVILGAAGGALAGAQRRKPT